MTTLLAVLLGLSMLGVLGVLGFGMAGLVRGGGDPRRSNKLMQYRVILQAVALVLAVLLISLLKS